jgi:putative DNA primase/helicase
MSSLDALRPVVDCDRQADAAAIYATGGVPTFPLHTPGPDGRCSCRRDCGRDNGKHPRTLRGLKDATTDLAKISYWWDVWRQANIGLATGFVFWVLDIDPGKGGEDTIMALEVEHGEIPPTWTVVTGSGGLHFWFLWLAGYGIRNSSGETGIGPGVDVRGAGGYVVAPPSLHMSGGRYAWSEGWSPANVPLATAPAWLADLASKKARMGTAAVPLGDDSVFGEGQRNEILTSLGGTMRRRGFSESAILAALRVENGGRCVPPLEDDEVAKIAASVARYQAGPILLRHRPQVAAPTNGSVRGRRPPLGQGVRRGSR